MKKSRLLGAVCACMAYISSTTTSASLLYDNGPINDPNSSGSCNQGPTGCGSSGTWTYYDNFSLGNDSNITGFDYTDWFRGGGPSNYVTTNWSIWDSDPFTASSPLVASSSVATLAATGPVDQYLFTIDSLNIDLTAGTYWLGINNTVTGGIHTTITTATGGLVGGKQSDGDLYDKDINEERAFRIYGTAVVPIPAAAWLFVGGLLWLIGVARRREA